MKYVIRDDCQQNGRTWVKSWRIVRHEPVAMWTAEKSEAMRFDDEFGALLLSLCVGGRLVKRVPRTPQAKAGG